MKEQLLCMKHDSVTTGSTQQIHNKCGAKSNKLRKKILFKYKMSFIADIFWTTPDALFQWHVDNMHLN